MAKCKACGAEIIWIRSASGKSIPCDAKKIHYVADPNGEAVLVLPNGNVTRGTVDPGSGDYGYVSHFATCPKAGTFRRR